jgi:hypothetical protein
LDLCTRLELDRFFEQAVDHERAELPWSRMAALLAINRLCAPVGHTLKHLLKGRPASGSNPSAIVVDDCQPMSPMKAIALLSSLQSADIVLPTTDGRSQDPTTPHYRANRRAKSFTSTTRHQSAGASPVQSRM